MSQFWFKTLGDVVENHFITANVDEMPSPLHKYKDYLQGRAMLVKKLKILPVEAIVRGYITGNEFYSCGEQSHFLYHSNPNLAQQVLDGPSIRKREPYVIFHYPKDWLSVRNSPNHSLRLVQKPRSVIMVMIILFKNYALIFLLDF